MIDNPFIRYVILLSHVPGKAISETVVREHVTHLKMLEQKQQLVLCGPFKDYDGGMVVIKAKSLEDAENIALSDPFIKKGIETYELRTLELSCKENNHLGMG